MDSNCEAAIAYFAGSTFVDGDALALGYCFFRLSSNTVETSYDPPDCDADADLHCICTKFPPSPPPPSPSPRAPPSSPPQPPPPPGAPPPPSQPDEFMPHTRILTIVLVCVVGLALVCVTCWACVGGAEYEGEATKAPAVVRRESDAKPLLDIKLGLRK